MARTFPTDGVSPCDFYGHGQPTRALGHFQWDLTGGTIPAADAMVLFDINDATTISTGTIYGFKVDDTVSGTKTGGKDIAMGIRLTISGASTRNTALEIYTVVGEYVTNSLRGIRLYMDTCTTSPATVYGIDVNIVGTSLTACHAFQVYNHGTSAFTSVFNLPNAAQDIATNLFIFGAANQLPLSASTTGEAVTQKVACLVGGATRYLHLHSQ